MHTLVIPTHKRPPHLGEVLRELYLNELGLTCKDLAAALNVSYVRLNEILNGRRGITPDTAMRLGRVLGTSDTLWMNMQTVVDLYDARHSPEAKGIAMISTPPQTRLVRRLPRPT
jgi:addiction module HigA family antidote